MKLLSTS